MILIHPAKDKIFFQGFRLALDQLIRYKHELIVINCASEHWGEREFILQMHDDLQSSGFDFWILSHHPGDHLIKPCVIFYPWWYHYSIKNFEKVDIQKHRSRILGCLHGNLRPHRIANYLALIERFQLHQMHLSLGNIDFSDQRSDDVVLLEKEHDQRIKLKKLTSTTKTNLN